MVVLCRDGLGRVYSSRDPTRTFRRCFVLLTSPHRQSTTSGLPDDVGEQLDSFLALLQANLDRG